MPCAAMGVVPRANPRAGQRASRPLHCISGTICQWPVTGGQASCIAPSPYHRWCQLPAHHKMAPGMAHFHVGGPRASTMICIVAPGPAWGESMLPADLFCWPTGLILMRCPLPEAMGRGGGCQAKTDGVSPPQTGVFRPVWPPDKPVACSCDGRRAKTDGPGARNLTGPWAKTDGPGVPGVDPIA